MEFEFEGQAKFQSDRLSSTNGAIHAAGFASIAQAAHRHYCGDWGDVDSEDAALNEDALANPGSGRMMSVFTIEDVKLWVITEYDRSLTTVLLPEEY